MYIETVLLLTFKNGMQYVTATGRTIEQYVSGLRNANNLSLSSTALKCDLKNTPHISVLFTGSPANARAVMRSSILELNTTYPNGYNNPTRII